MANRLSHETSPYLLQHAHNPVDWYPWGEEALERARREGKPILLSIGYSACHWCHVMERESFEDEETARLMNENFVSIKVDREERPDLDSIYMTAVQALTGSGGWPLTVFLTPEGEPFHGGTYFPPDDRPGMPSFRRILAAVAEAYRTRRGDVAQSARTLMEHLERTSPAQPVPSELLTPQVLADVYHGLLSQFDRQHGGFGPAPKFPQAIALEFLLRFYKRTGDPEALQMVEQTLTAMARGGMYDQIDGGFHRYATDAAWLVPHFEKMLYDNALLARVYLYGYQVTGNPLYRRICEETLDYVLREMTDQQGGFYSSQDADTEGEEGKYYVWSAQEIDALLGSQDARILRAYYGVTEAGNFEGRSILHVAEGAWATADDWGLSPGDVEEAVRRGREKLRQARSWRVPPGRDEKILTAWNGLMLRSFAEAAATLGRDDYRRAALANAAFLAETMSRDGRLLRTYKAGHAPLKGYLEDYASFIDGLMATYEATFSRRWLKEAHRLADRMLDLFWDPGRSTFYDTGMDHEPLVIRPRGIFDSATPSGGSMACWVLLRLSSFTGEARYASVAASALRSVRDLMTRHPTGFGQWLAALDYYLSVPKEITIIGPWQDPRTQALLNAVHRRFLPNRVLTGSDPEGAQQVQDMPLLQGKTLIDGQPTAYVCEQYGCREPVTSPEGFAAQLTRL